MPPNTDLPGLHIAIFINSWIAALINPFIYVFSNEFYKNAFWKTFNFKTKYSSTRKPRFNSKGKLTIKFSKGSSKVKIGSVKTSTEEQKSQDHIKDTNRIEVVCEENLK